MSGSQSIVTIVGESGPISVEKKITQIPKRQRNGIIDITKVDRLPPHSLEAEQGALGCLMLDPEKVRGIMTQKLRAGSIVFYDLRHQQIYDCVLGMTGAMDMITISQRLKDSHELEAVGGLAYLSSLMDATPSAANITYYVEILLEKWRLRSIIATATDAVTKVYEGSGSASEISTVLVSESSRVFVTTLDQQTIRDSSRDVVDGLYARMSGEADGGISIGIRDVDKYVRGFGKKYVVVAARPSMGKTSLFCTIARNVSMLGRGHVGFVSLEMDISDITTRIIEIESDLSFRDYKWFKEEEIRTIERAKARVAAMPILYHHQIRMDVNQVCAVASGWAAEHKISCLMVDYLTKVKGSKEYFKEQDRYNEVSERMFALSKSLDVPVFLAHQLNRSAEEERPRLHHLAGSGQIEGDADVVMLLHQQANTQSRSRMKTVQSEILIEKHRGGETGDALVEFRRYSGLFCDYPINTELPYG